MLHTIQSFAFDNFIPSIKEWFVIFLATKDFFYADLIVSSQPYFYNSDNSNLISISAMDIYKKLIPASDVCAFTEFTAKVISNKAVYATLVVVEEKNLTIKFA